jgi:hypothetical protein
MRSVVVVVVGAIACGKSQPPSPPPTPTTTAAAHDAAAATPPDAAASALPPKLVAARCDDPCLFLLDTPLAQLGDAVKAACPAKSAVDVGYKDCAQIDYLRNCIYAAHGVAYKKNKWKKLFAAKPWYEPRAGADPKKLAMSEIEHANVHELYLRGKACKSSLRISGADYERVKAWFAPLPKPPPLPKVLAFGDEDRLVTASQFVESLVDALGEGTKETPDLSQAVARYVELDGEGKEGMCEPLIAALTAMKPAPRIIQLTFAVPGGGAPENPVDEGTYVWLVYDAKDRLVAAGARHYLWD